MNKSTLLAFNGRLATEINELLDVQDENSGIPRTGYKLIRLIKKSMAAALHRGENVNIHGFGIFKIIERTPRTIKRPFIWHKPLTQSMEPFVHKPEKTVKFYPSVQLKAMRNPDSPSCKERRTRAKW